MEVNPFTYLPDLINLVKQTGTSILEIYSKSHQFKVRTKADTSPLTQADLLAHEKIVQSLHKLTPEFPILSEEDEFVPFDKRREWLTYWLVDPLDGTKEFIRHSGDFAINIALIVNQEAVFGLIYAPVSDELFCAARGKGAYYQSGNSAAQLIHFRKFTQPLKITVGHYYKIEKLKPLVAPLGDYEIFTLGSSLKFCAIAQGRADFYPRLGSTYEWDTAAGQIIVEEAGGIVVDFAGKPLRYNSKESLLNPHFFALGDAAQLLEKIHKVILMLNIK